MNALRKSLAVVTTRAPDDDSDVHHLLTPKQEAFACAWASTGNKGLAYRQSYDVKETTLPNVVWVNASRLAALPKVEARYKELLQQASLETIMSVRELYQHAVDIATADPNELVKVVARNCRHCRGEGHYYQWKDNDEFMAACIAALDNEKPPPSDAGGYEFNGALEPIPTCPYCYGVGHEQTVITDTTKLTGKARKLYAGAEQDRFGAIKLKTHDQKAYHEMACRMAGAFKDTLDIRTPEERAKADAAAKLPDNISADDAAKGYLRLLG